jgi:uncharacterized 2Fe-2S/4Fe-4S cluster protein (DUF4445 family)
LDVVAQLRIHNVLDRSGKMGSHPLVRRRGSQPEFVLAESDIQQVFIAGAFGTFIDIQSAITIGMLPRLPLERFRQVGNAAGTGARLAHISRVERARTRQISRNVGYIELANFTGFQRKFAASTYLD